MPLDATCRGSGEAALDDVIEQGPMASKIWAPL